MLKPAPSLVGLMPYIQPIMRCIRIYTNDALVLIHAVLHTCRYYAPDILRPGQYNTMVRLPIAMFELLMNASTASLLRT
jgi:hypothetical protein